MPFQFTPLAIPDVILIEPRVFSDARGSFLETYKRSDFLESGITEEFVQDNHSRSAEGVLRGLHYQRPPHAQGKLVRVVLGRAWDVAVDIRPSSPTFGTWVSAFLDGSDLHMLYIPPGFAHGFVALEDDTDFVYKCTAEYHKASEGGIRWNDPDLSIEWPIHAPTVSEKDQALPRFKEAEPWSG
jgi:dTDP-4-dehydrorhamnose 3,5-epimerase